MTHPSTAAPDLAGPVSGVHRSGKVSAVLTIIGLIILIGTVSLTVWGLVDSAGKTANPDATIRDAAIPAGGLWVGLHLTLSGLGIPDRSVARISGVTSLVLFGLLLAYLWSLVP
ncbi:hypothetical protein ACGFYQ_40845 [Streptomyces sp. NPDC048258]|uniref:hypothetical protein n=1 Tax=Streptomyces sp. NPDC048258 TaxID=3365527 RepID=UPI0037237559